MIIAPMNNCGILEPEKRREEERGRGEERREGEDDEKRKEKEKRREKVNLEKTKFPEINLMTSNCVKERRSKGKK